MARRPPFWRSGCAGSDRRADPYSGPGRRSPPRQAAATCIPASRPPPEREHSSNMSWNVMFCHAGPAGPLRYVMRCHVLHAQGAYPLSRSGMGSASAPEPAACTHLRRWRRIAWPAIVTLRPPLSPRPPSRGPARPLRRTRPSRPPSSDGSGRESRGWTPDQVRGDKGEAGATGGAGGRTGCEPGRDVRMRQPAGGRGGSARPAGLPEAVSICVPHVVHSSRFVPLRSVLPAVRSPERRDPDSRVSCAPAPARAGARIAAARFARLIARARRRAHLSRAFLRGFFAPARTAKRSGPAEAASLLLLSIITQIL